MPQEIYTHTFPNGLTLLAERMPHVRSAAFKFMLPAGCVNDPVNQLGLSTVLAEMMSRSGQPRQQRTF